MLLYFFFFFHSLDLAILYYVCRFLNKGGVMILATWLSQAAVEEQTSVLLVILKVYTDFMRLIWYYLLNKHCLGFQ